MESVESKVNGYVLGPAEGVPGFDSSTKASKASTGGSLTVIESHTRGGAPMHLHHAEDESFYVLDGSIIVHCGDRVFEAGPHAFVFLPQGIPHAWDVTSGAATVLIITVPGGIEEFLREFHETQPSTDEARNRVAAEYGIAWVRDTGKQS